MTELTATYLVTQPELPHYQVIGNTLMMCEQFDCDGVHHYYAACEH